MGYSSERKSGFAGLSERGAGGRSPEGASQGLALPDREASAKQMRSKDASPRSNERIQKIIANAGFCSRREAEKWIAAGRVFVNGKKVTELGTKADAYRDKIIVNGKPLTREDKKVYYLFYKPRNVMVTHHDPEGRPTVFDYLQKIEKRVYPVGRLDFDSEGLLLLTNDGDLAYELTHPKSKVPKTYQVKVMGIPTEAQIKKLEAGIKLDWGTTAPAAIEITKKTEKNCWMKITLTEGKNRQVREMVEKIGLHVIKLRRIAIGLFRLGDLKPGQYKKVHHK
ncbi:MAG: pseudouridine synthase [Deltaproteobacteria bacterium]|nr:pseudouridine synthase [Deltaproteobacteria bacterium]